jgi:hypothetical protein
MIRVGRHMSYGAGAKLLGEVFEMPVSERQLGQVAKKEGEPSDFAKRLVWRATVSGFDLARHQVVVADGAAWIWKVVEEEYPLAVQILDLYHVKARLVEVTLARRGGKESSAESREEGVKSRLDALKRGRLESVIEELERCADCAACRDCARYFRNQRSRMDYPRYRRRGWCCSSAVIKSACKHIVGSWEDAGRRWNVEGANEPTQCSHCAAPMSTKRWTRTTNDGARTIS